MTVSKKTILTYGLVLILIIIGICYFKFKPFTSKSINSSDQPTINWNVYRNEKLGFGIKYPSQSLIWAGACDPGTGISNGYVPVEVFEGDNFVYIDSEYQYQQIDGGCAKVENPFPAIEDRRWRITITDNIKNDGDLDQFVHEYFTPGNNCSLGEQKPFKQANVYEVYPKWDDKDLGESECYINYGVAILYFPEKNKVAAWETGQEDKFWGDEEGHITYDQEMIDSFRFIE